MTEMALIQVALLVKNQPASARDTRDFGSIPGSGRSPGGGNGTHSSILAWEIPWTKEPGGLQPVALQSRTRLSTHALRHSSVLILPVNCFLNTSPYGLSTCLAWDTLCHRSIRLLMQLFSIPRRNVPGDTSVIKAY